MGIVSFSNMRVARPAYHTRDVSFLRIAAVFFHSSSHVSPFFSLGLPRKAVPCQTLILSLMRADVDELITVFNCATQHKAYAPSHNRMCVCVCCQGCFCCAAKYSNTNIATMAPCDRST